MTEQELRQLVRQAIARVQSAGATSPSHLSHPPLVHASHLMLPVASGADADGPCIIEPAVPCMHCGYCKSLGH